MMMGGLMMCPGGGYPGAGSGMPGFMGGGMGMGMGMGTGQQMFGGQMHNQQQHQQPFNAGYGQQIQPAGFQYQQAAYHSNGAPIPQYQQNMAFQQPAQQGFYQQTQLGPADLYQQQQQQLQMQYMSQSRSF